jgi:hypothetical protein
MDGSMDTEVSEQPMSLVKDFNGIVDGYYAGSQAYNRIVAALEHYEEIMLVVQVNSLARDGWEQIEFALRENE